MRVRSAVLLAVSAALLGGGVVLAVAAVAGWLGGGGRTVVFRQLSQSGAPTAVAVAKPLLGNGFQPAELFRRRSPGVVTITSFFGKAGSAVASAGQGSGFVVSRAGLILTDAHVITTAGQSGVTKPARARSIYVQFADGDRLTAHVVGYDLYDDVGLLRVDPEQHPLAPVPLGNSGAVVVGQPVAAIGSPFGNADSLSVGVVSAVGRSIPSLTTSYNLVDAIQTDAPINHGNSGGPLLDAEGRAIGITAQIRSNGVTSGFEGVGFAVPINAARRSLQQLLATGHVAYAYVGIASEDLTPSIARAFGYRVRRGALIDQVRLGSPAQKGGLHAGTASKAFEGTDVVTGGDVVVAIDGTPVRNATDLVRIVAERLLPGQIARFTVVRDGRTLTLPLRLAARGSTS